ENWSSWRREGLRYTQPRRAQVFDAGQQERSGRGESRESEVLTQGQWTDRLPQLRGQLTTFREVAEADAYTLFTLFGDPGVTTYMAPPPPTLAKFAGFVEWSRDEREHGRGLCFGIVPHGMTTAVGILQVRSLDPTAALFTAEWGVVLSAHF